MHLFLQHRFLLHDLVYLNQHEQVLIYQHLIYLLFSQIVEINGNIF